MPSSDAGPDASAPDAGSVDAGIDAGIDAGPVCSAEICDGIDNDCDGLVDEGADGGVLFGLCPLQAGICSGAQIACVGGAYPPCTAAQYGVKYEEFESLCDGVDNDCSGVVDVSHWKPIGAAGTTTLAVSVPGAWYVQTGLNAQMFDETLTPLSDVYAVGKPGYVGGSAAWFGDTIHTLFAQGPATPYLRRLNLDGTLLDEVPVPLVGVTLPAGGLRVSNDKAVMVLGLTQGNHQSLLSFWPDGGTRAGPTFVGDGGVWNHTTTAIGANDFVASVPYPDVLELYVVSADLVWQGPPLRIPVPAHAIGCAVSSNTHAADAGLDAIAVACPAGATLYGMNAPFGAGLLTPLFVADAGITSVSALPSYAKATVFWLVNGTVHMGQVDGLPPVELAQLTPAPPRLTVAESVRGGYLLQAVFDGGQGLRPYGAYACPP